MIVLSATDIKKEYGTDVILQDISFHINGGDKVGLIGANVPRYEQKTLPIT